MKKIVIFSFLILILFVNIFLPAFALENSKASNVEITPKKTIVGGKAKAKPSSGVATGILGVSPPPPKRRWAIIIGISDYAGEENDINYADDDALDMLKTLTEIYSYKRENILLLISDYYVNNATHDKIIEAINYIKDKEKSGDEVIFFYSGYGARGKANDGDNEAIVPYECTADSLIWDGELKALFANFNTSRIIFIFDSCYSGGMTDLKANGRIVVMASTENDLSYESSTLENGIFTYYFIDEGMFQSKADMYDNIPSVSDVTIEESFDYAKAVIRKVVPQTPTISDSFTNDLLL